MAKKKEEDSSVLDKPNLNKTISMGLLDSYRTALYQVQKFYDTVDFDKYGEDVELKIKVMTAVLKAGESLGKNIESLDKLEDKVKREEKESITRRGKSESSLFEE